MVVDVDSERGVVVVNPDAPNELDLRNLMHLMSSFIGFEITLWKAMIPLDDDTAVYIELDGSSINMHIMRNISVMEYIERVKDTEYTERISRINIYLYGDDTKWEDVSLVSVSDIGSAKIIMPSDVRVVLQYSALEKRFDINAKNIAKYNVGIELLEKAISMLALIV